MIEIADRQASENVGSPDKIYYTDLCAVDIFRLKLLNLLMFQKITISF